MENSNIITVSAFCSYHQVDFAFLVQVQEIGVVEMPALEEDLALEQEELYKLEQVVRLHKELHINADGIGAVLQLLEKVEQLQQENRELKSKLARMGL